ncbi:MAG TPA: alanine:cation symporter family protein [Candidatus Marinimicrobia bacterium]|nr:alanine:cation symporter family protein [Candidatus Neomarinimicrobiota bacterium]
MLYLEKLASEFASLMWGYPLLILMMGGGVFFTVYSRFTPFRFFRHGVKILLGQYDNPQDPGDLTHFQALSTALASTVGMGNISGVAVAISMGGPGALFWMWISAFVGMSTKFFTCTLSIMFRGKDDRGDVQGGPMYVIETALGRKFKALAILFSTAGLIGCLPLFQANQLTQIIRDEIWMKNGWFTDSVLTGNLMVGIPVAGLVAFVIFGGIKRIGYVASRLVPLMVSLYLLAGIFIVITNLAHIPDLLALIFSDAFSGKAAAGGVIGSVIITGVRRASFSNEAGLGTEAMAHGAAKTREPVREGLVAMLGPFIDTIVVCSITGIVILLSGLWQGDETSGVTLTTMAFSQELGSMGKLLLLICVFIFSLTTMFGQSYYGSKCTGYLFGTRWQQKYNLFYVIAVIFGAVVSLNVVINIIDGVYALMAIPTMVSALLLSPQVMNEAKRYFTTLKQ